MSRREQLQHIVRLLSLCLHGCREGGLAGRQPGECQPGLRGGRCTWWGSSEDIGISGITPNSGSAQRSDAQIQIPTMGVMIERRTGSVNVVRVVWNHLSL